METERLRAFCAVAETGSLREAASLLGISNGGLSKSLKVLERDLGAQLLAPSGRGIVVTDAGRRFYRAAKRLLPEIDALAEVAIGAPEDRGEPVRIGTFEVFSTYFMGELVERELAGARVLVRELVPGAIEEALAADEIDIGLTYVPIPRPEIDFVRVATLEMAAYGRRDRFAEMDPREWPFCAPAIPIHGSPTSAKGLDGWPDDVLARRVVYSADMMETALELCRRGLAVVFLPTFVARLHNHAVTAASHLEELPTPRSAARIRRDVYVVKRRCTVESPHIRKIARALRLVTRSTPTRRGDRLVDS